MDPLDGTRNFMQFGHDYCVNIGLVENGQASFGVVADPADLSVGGAEVATGLGEPALPLMEG